MNEFLREIIEEKIAIALAGATDGEIQGIASILGITIPDGVI